MEIDMMGYLVDGDVPTDIRIASVRGGCGARTNLAMAEVVSDEARSLAILSVAVNSTFTPDELFGNISSNAVRNAECIDALAALADVDTDSRVAAQVRERLTRVRATRGGRSFRSVAASHFGCAAVFVFEGKKAMLGPPGLHSSDWICLLQTEVTYRGWALPVAWSHENGYLIVSHLQAIDVERFAKRVPCPHSLPLDLTRGLITVGPRGCYKLVELDCIRGQDVTNMVAGDPARRIATGVVQNERAFCEASVRTQEFNIAARYGGIIVPRTANGFGQNLVATSSDLNMNTVKLLGVLRAPDGNNKRGFFTYGIGLPYF